jgi:hypothetical protein
MSPGSLRGRVGRLESAPHAPGGCPECGVDPNAPVRYEVIWEDEAASKIAEAFIGGEVRRFEDSRYEEAWRWVRS